VVSSRRIVNRGLYCEGSIEKSKHRSFAVVTEKFPFRLYQPPAHSVAHKTCCLVDIQLLHESHAVRFGCFHADTKKEAASFVDFPSAINCSTCRSRPVKGSAGLSDLERYASITARDMPGLDRSLLERPVELRESGRLRPDSSGRIPLRQLRALRGHTVPLHAA